MARIILVEHVTVHGSIVLLLAISGTAIILWDPAFFTKPLALADFYVITAGIPCDLQHNDRKIGHVHWSLKLGPAWADLISIMADWNAAVSFTDSGIQYLPHWLDPHPELPDHIYHDIYGAIFGTAHLPVQRSSYSIFTQASY